MLSNGKENFCPTDRNDQAGQSGPPTEGGLKYSGRIEPKWSVQLISNRNFRNLGMNEKGP